MTMGSRATWISRALSTAEALLRDAHGVVEHITIRSAEHEQVDVADGAHAAFAGVPGRPRTEDVRLVDALDLAYGVSEHGGHPERPSQYVAQPFVVGTL